jgi:hypothetical protein
MAIPREGALAKACAKVSSMPLLELPERDALKDRFHATAVPERLFSLDDPDFLGPAGVCAGVAADGNSEVLRPGFLTIRFGESVSYSPTKLARCRAVRAASVASQLSLVRGESQAEKNRCCARTMP